MGRANILEEMSPLPATLEEAREEIIALRLRLLDANAKWGKAAEATMTARLQVGLLQKQLNLHDDQGVALKYLRTHFETHKYHWWSKKDILRELDQLSNGGQGIGALSTKKKTT